MLENTKKRIENISNEVDELHPLLANLFQQHPKISHYEYTHGPDELGADFILTRTDDILDTTEHIGIIAKRGKIHLDLTNVERQIEECTMIPRKIEGGKKEVILSQVWVVATDTITKGAREKIHAKYPGTNVTFIPGDKLASLVYRFIPYYGAEVRLPVSSYLSDTAARTEELDRNSDLLQLGGEPIYIPQDVVRVEIDPYRRGKRKKDPKYKRVDIKAEIANNKLLLVEANMGGGKTKLLRKLNQHYADVTAFAEEKVIPVYATFKELVDTHESNLDLLRDNKVPQAAQEAAEKDSEYLFLIDAVDEKDMPPEELADTLTKIADAVDRHPYYRLALTSRHIANVDFDKRFLNRFAKYEIPPLSMGKIVNFLNLLCRKLNLHTRIVEDLQRSSLFERLPRNPIAAVLLGQLLKENQKELPLTMTELYEKYMELSLGRWDIQKGLQSQQEFETLETVLMDLAQYMIENELEAVSSQEVEDRFAGYLNERNLSVTVKQLIDRAVKRADILARSSDGYSLWFKHRSFAEFLYAKWLIKRGDLEPSLRAFELYWANSYFFGLGLQKDAPDLLEKLIQLPPEKDSQRWVKLLNLADYSGGHNS